MAIINVRVLNVIDTYSANFGVGLHEWLSDKFSSTYIALNCFRGYVSAAAAVRVKCVRVF